MSSNIQSFHRRQDKVAVADNKSQGTVGSVDSADRAVVVEAFGGLKPGDPVSFDNGTFKTLLGRTSRPITGTGTAFVESKFGVTLGEPHASARCATSKGVYREGVHVTDVHYGGCEKELEGKVGKQLGEIKADSRFVVESDAAALMKKHRFHIKDGVLRNFTTGVGFNWDLNSADANRFVRVSQHSETAIRILMIEVDGDELEGTYDLVSDEYAEHKMGDGIFGPTAVVTKELMERVAQHSEYADMGRAIYETPSVDLSTYIQVVVDRGERAAYIAPDASHFFISEKVGDNVAWQRQNFIPG